MLCKEPKYACFGVTDDKCLKCLGSANLKNILVHNFESNDIDTVLFNQWITTDR